MRQPKWLHHVSRESISSATFGVRLNRFLRHESPRQMR